jgi:hypothetical protein
MTAKTNVTVTKPTLSARFMETMPDADERPIKDNAAVREEAARRVMAPVHEVIPGVALDSLEAALIWATRWESEPVTIAAKLASRLKIEETPGLIEALSTYAYEREVCHEMMVKTWVRARGVKPELAQGDEAIITISESAFKNRSLHGVIVEIDSDTAKYTVRCRNGATMVNHSVAFEDTVRRGAQIEADEEEAELA